MARRVFGKLAFFTLQDNTGVIQLYIDKGRLEEEFNVRCACGVVVGAFPFHPSC